MREPRRLRLGEHHVDLSLWPGAFDTLPAALDQAAATRPLIVIDELVHPHLGHRIDHLLHRRQATVTTAVASERHKLLAQVATLAELGAESDAVVAVGGGTTGNLAGALAHLLGFGVPLIHVPTTVTSIVDAAISARHTLNTRSAKSALGVHHVPSAILADPTLLASLPAHQWAEGAVEAVKAAFVAGGTRAAQLATRLSALNGPVADLDELAELLGVAVELKLSTLADDPTERGSAVALHYGHTFARAIETLADGTISHGRAVATGMRAAAGTAERLGLITRAERQQHDELIWHIGLLPVDLRPIPTDQLLRLMTNDPKARIVRPGRGIPLVLLDRLGHAYVSPESRLPVTAVPKAVAAAALGGLHPQVQAGELP